MVVVELRESIFYRFQIDLRDDPKTIAKLNDMKEKPIATEQGQKLAKEVCICACFFFFFLKEKK